MKTGPNDPCTCGSGKKYKKCCGTTGTDAADSGGRILSTLSTKGFYVSQNFKARTDLVKFGPLIKAQWQVDPDTQKELTLRGWPIPKPVEGYMLVDTGAYSTVIDSDVAKEMGLVPTGRETISGIGGEGLTYKYLAQIFLFVGDVHGAGVAISLHNEFVSGNIRKLHEMRKLTEPDGTPIQVIGLLGRDFLKFATLTYKGSDGSWDMHIHENVMRPWE